MRADSHNTWIGFVRDAVEAWRKREGWSQATAVQEIIDVHVRIGGDVRTGIRFEPPTKDAFERMRINSERVYRWLDEGKDNNLLGVPFCESIIAALPADLRHECVSAMLGRNCGLIVHFSDQTDGRFDVGQLLHSVIKESGEAESAMVDLVDGATYDELIRAQLELAESVAAHKTALAAVEGELTRVSAWRPHA